MVYDPSLRFEGTPSTFSEKSRIVGVTTSYNYCGMVMDSIDELETTLFTFHADRISEIRGFRKRFGNSSKSSFINNEEFLRSADIKNYICKLLMMNVVKYLREARHSDEFLSYYVLSDDHHIVNPRYGQYCIVHVSGSKVGDKYVLEFGNIERDSGLGQLLGSAYGWAQRVDRDAIKWQTRDQHKPLEFALTRLDPGESKEYTLAHFLEKFQKPLAFKNASISIGLSVVDRLWFNIHLDDLLINTPIPKEQIRQAAGTIVGLEMRQGILSFEYKKRPIHLGMHLLADTGLSYSGGDANMEYLEVRGSSLVGASWRDFKNGPKIVLTVSLPGYDYLLDDEKIKLVREVAAFLTNSIKPKE